MFNKNKYIYCNNCGKTGHNSKKCLEPITSCGVILFKIDFDNLKKDLNIELNDKIYKNFNEELNIKKYNNDNINNIEKNISFKKYIKFLLISRKNSLGFLEFMRGRYDTNDIDSIINLYKQMYKNEIEKLKTLNFDDLWLYTWNLDKINKDKDFYESKKKYEIIKKNSFLDYCCDNIVPTHDTLEWGFPKGRRSYVEKNKDCATREFNEETNLKKEDYQIIDEINPETEELIGTNKKKYKHIYYFGYPLNNNKLYVDKNNVLQYKEVGNIGWYNYDDTSNMIRNYHINKKIIVNNIYIFLCNLIINNK